MTGITVQLKNHSADPVAIVAREGAESFRLIQNDRWNPNQYRWVGEDTVPRIQSVDEVVVLQSGEKHETYLDLKVPKWFLTKVESNGSDEPAPMEALEMVWSESFRVEYVPPTAEECIALPHAELIRKVGLRSRAFSPARGVD